MLNQEISKQFLSYLNGIVTSTLKVGIAGSGGRGGWVPSRFCGGCVGRSGLSGAFHTIFVLYLNDLPS